MLNRSLISAPIGVLVGLAFRLVGNDVLDSALLGLVGLVAAFVLLSAWHTKEGLDYRSGVEGRGTNDE
jgi:hypothetical protein